VRWAGNAPSPHRRGAVDGRPERPPAVGKQNQDAGPDQDHSTFGEQPSLESHQGRGPLGAASASVQPIHNFEDAPPRQPLTAIDRGKPVDPSLKTPNRDDARRLAVITDELLRGPPRQTEQRDRTS
jgi:hypothetical protein